MHTAHQFTKYWLGLGGWLVWGASQALGQSPVARQELSAATLPTQSPPQSLMLNLTLSQGVMLFGVSLLGAMALSGLYVLLSVKRRESGLRQHLNAAQQEKRQTEQELEDQYYKYRVIVETSQEGIALLDENLKFSFANSRMAEMLKIAPESLPGMGIERFVITKDQQDSRAFMMETLRNQPFDRHAMVRARDAEGRSLWLAISYTAFFNKAGNVNGVIVLASDVTREKQAERDLQASEVRYRQLVEGSGQGIIIRREWKPVFVNGLMAQMLGFAQPQDVLALPTLADHVHPEDAPAIILSTEQLLTGQRDFCRQEFRIVNLQQQAIWVEGYSRLVTWGGQSAIQSVVQNVSERHHLEQQLGQTRKMEALGLMASGIAHNVNNMLTPIMGFSEMAMAKLQDAEQNPQAVDWADIRADMEEVVTHTLRGKKLVEQVMMFQQSAKEPQVFVLNQLAKDVLRLVTPTVPAGIHLETDLPDMEMLVRGDPMQLQQALVNLLRQGIKNLSWQQAPPQGQLRFALGFVTLAPGNPYRQGHQEHHALLTIQDNGPLLPAERLNRAFEPFFSLRENEEGDGVGLAFVQSIVLQHKGSIMVEGTPPQGTRFQVYLPLDESTELDG